MTNCLLSLALVLGSTTSEEPWPQSPVPVSTVTGPASTVSSFDWSASPTDSVFTDSFAATDNSAPPDVSLPVTTRFAGGLTDRQLAALVFCESSGRYDIDSGNGYRGAVQWLQSTWDAAARTFGRTDLVGVNPAHVDPATQDELTRWWWTHSNPYQQWPACAPIAMRGAA